MSSSIGGRNFKPTTRSPSQSAPAGPVARPRTQGVRYLLNARSAGYFPIRSAQPYIDSGELALIKRSPRFVYPAYAVYPEDRDEEAYEPILASLKEVVATMS